MPIKVGYKITAQDNGSFMFDDCKAIERCKKCGFRLDFMATNPDYRPPKSTWDIGATYDNQKIVSRRFREIIEQADIPGAIFYSFRKSDAFFHFQAKEIVPIDMKKGFVKFRGHCSDCGNFRHINGSSEDLAIDRPLALGFYRGDVFMASGDEKSAPIYVCTRTYDILSRFDLRYIDFTTVFGRGGLAG